MKKWLKIVALGSVALAVAGAAIFALRLSELADRSQVLAQSAVNEPFPLADCDALQRPATPNHWLAASSDCEAVADATAPSFAISADAQATLWRQWLVKQADVQVVPAGEDPLQIVSIATTTLFGFSDVVAIKVIPLDQEKSTLAIYSRSLVGESDLDANRDRVRRWLVGFTNALEADDG